MQNKTKVLSILLTLSIITILFQVWTTYNIKNDYKEINAKFSSSITQNGKLDSQIMLLEEEIKGLEEERNINGIKYSDLNDRYNKALEHIEMTNNQ